MMGGSAVSLSCALFEAAAGQAGLSAAPSHFTAKPGLAPSAPLNFSEVLRRLGHVEEPRPEFAEGCVVMSEGGLWVFGAESNEQAAASELLELSAWVGDGSAVKSEGGRL